MIRKKPNNTPKKFQTKVVQKKKTNKQTNKQTKNMKFSKKKKNIKKIEIVILIINYYHIARARAT